MSLRRLAHFFVRQVVLNPVVLLVVAVLGCIIGGVLLYDVPTYAARAARAERLRPLSAAALADSPAGREALVEGVVSDRMPPVHRSFVAYVREEYRSNPLPTDVDDSPSWVEVERVTPPLLVTVPDGEVRLANDDYLLDSTSFTFREAEPTVTKGAIQSRGYRPGDQVVVVGPVASTGGQPAVHAEFVYAGTRAAYIAEMRALARRSLPVGGAFLLVGLASGVATVWQTRRFLRELAAEQSKSL